MKTSKKIISQLAQAKKMLPPTVLWVVLLNFAYFPIAQAFGWIEPFWAARAATSYAHWDMIICLILCFSFSFLLLVAPMGWSNFLGEEVWEFPDFWQWSRVFQVGILWSLVTVSFGYFTGEYVGSFQVLDYCLVAILPSMVGAVYYFKTQRFFSTTLLLGLCLFFGIFLTGDILGPFPTFIKYKIVNEAAYALRFSLGLISIVTVILLKKDWSLREENLDMSAA